MQIKLHLLMAMIFLQGCTHSYTAHLVEKNLQHIHLSPTFHIKRSQKWGIPHDTNIVVSAYNAGISRQEGFNSIDHAQFSSKRDFYRSMLSPRVYHRFQSMLVSHLSTYFPRVMLITEDSIDQSLRRALEQGADLLFLPSIVEQSDIVNTYDERRFNKLGHDKKVGKDTFTFKIVIYEVASGNIIDTCIVLAKSAVITSNKYDVDWYTKMSVEKLVNSIKL